MHIQKNKLKLINGQINKILNNIFYFIYSTKYGEEMFISE